MATHERKPSDFYPTPPDVTQALIDAAGLSSRPLRIWEPACGDGAMSKVLAANGHQVHSTDLREDSGFGLGGIDFLDPLEAPWGGEPDAIITNPPFTLAEEFIRAAIRRAPLVAMLLKSNYWHTQRGLALYHSHPPTMEYKLTWRPAFLSAERGDNPIMDCSWCVWRRGSSTSGWRPIPRPSFVIVSHEKYEGEIDDHMWLLEMATVRLREIINGDD
jgi:hypothetical protein